ncbi:hypothetical protein H0H92_013679 [Tricholoma furcatifolium]|nr:hypothetical protein H0H92_013679 [Tricholoma furcatifolium]
MNPFVDLKVEGPIALSTAASRAEALKYIEEQIRVYTSIMNYYKSRHNSFTITCRIPSEILAIIFGQVVDDAHQECWGPGLGKQSQRRPSFSWIGRISHVCSHWREVALSTPDLWSTIQISYQAKWALETLLNRSRDVELSLIMWDSVHLEEVLGSHLPRIKNLNADQISLEGIHVLSRLLGERRDASTHLKMERLEMSSYAWAVQPQLPDSIFTALAPSAPLKHLALAGFGINWACVHLLNNLETFHISSIPETRRPLPVQVVRFLSQMPTLRHFSVDQMDPRWELSPSHDPDLDAQSSRIELKSLEHVKVACENPFILASFFNSLTLTNEIVEFVSKIDLSETSIQIADISVHLRALAQSMDNAHEGIISKAILKNRSIRFWKSENDLHFGPVSEYTSPQTTARVKGLAQAMIDLKGRSSRNTVSTFISNVLQGLRLDYLVSLEVNPGVNGFQVDMPMDVWTMIGDLPRIAHLTIHHYADHAFKVMESACPGLRKDMVEQSNAAALADTNNTVLDTARPTFPALTTLVFRRWNPWLESISMMMTDRLLGLVKLRAGANLPIKVLRFEFCLNVAEDTEFLHDLRQTVDQVIIVE